VIIRYKTTPLERVEMYTERVKICMGKGKDIYGEDRDIYGILLRYLWEGLPLVGSPSICRFAADQTRAYQAIRQYFN
jgi:hypothetical protein